MPRNIVICCDGTGNDFDQPDTDSNVVKLYNTLTINADQIAYYHPGVGTMGSPNVDGRLGKWWSKVKGLAFGSGLLDNVGDAYRYLMNKYQAGDRIFLFGFSRGSYTARAVGSLLHVYGLLEPGNEQLIPYILRLYAKMTKAPQGQETTFPPEDAFRYAFSRDVEVHFCGVWDTVSSYGWINSPINLRFNGQNPIIRTGRHAISIHEHRCCYQDNLWGSALPATADAPAQDLRQVWFAGVHSDVGGSYSESQAGLSKITFEWMLMQAMQQGLLVEDERVSIVLGRTPPPPCLPKYVMPNPKGELHPSLQRGWWVLEYFPRKKDGRWSLPRGKWLRQIPEGSLIHATVKLSGAPVPWPASFQEEPWVQYPQATPATTRDVAEHPWGGYSLAAVAEPAAMPQPPAAVAATRAGVEESAVHMLRRLTRK